MDIFYKVIAFLGGLAMFLYGMRVMGDGLKSSSGGAMKNALARVTNKPYMGFIFGMLVACIIQSSTATIVITVGLVGAGFLTFHQSIGIVLGANVGTAITAQIIRLMDVTSATDSPLYFFKADNLAPLALIIGIIMIMFVRKNTSKNIGNIACGFGVLFMGLIYMSSIVSEFGQAFSNTLVAFENNYTLGFLAGFGVTMVVQSSSAVIGIIQSIASSIGVSFQAIFAVMIGINIGDCITTYLVSRIGAKPNQIRTALVHIIYNVFAETLNVILVIIGRYSGLISDSLWTGLLDAGGIANLHGIFRLVPALMLLPLAGLFEKIALKIVKDKPVEEEDAIAIAAMAALDERLLNTPSIALDQVEVCVKNMIELSVHNFDACVQQIYNYDPARDDRIEAREELIDQITDATNNYIIGMSPYVTLDKDTRRQNYNLKAIICFERIGDLAVNITDSLKAMREQKLHFSSNAMAELRILIDATYEILDKATKSYMNQDIELATQVEPLEEVIDDLVEDMNARHVYRMVNKLCNAIVGIQFQNILTNIEHISDKCSDVAVYILEGENEEIVGNEHAYLHELHHSNNENYMKMYDDNYKNYFNKLNDIPVTDSLK